MVALVGDHAIAPAHQAAYDAQVDLKPGGVQQHGFLAHQVGQFLLQLQVDVQRAVQEPGASATGAVLVHGSLGGQFDLGVVGQAKIAVGAQHQDLSAVHDDLGVLRGRDGPEVWVQPRSADACRIVVVPHLVQQWPVIDGQLLH